MGAGSCKSSCGDVEPEQELKDLVPDATSSPSPAPHERWTTKMKNFSPPRLLSTGIASEAGSFKLEEFDHTETGGTLNPTSPGSLRRGRGAGFLMSPEVLNETIKYCWSDISQFAVHILGHSVEPAVRKALGGLGSKFAFKIAECHLGDKPVRFSEMESTTINDDGMRSLVWTGKVDWQGNLSIITTFTGWQLGITAMTLKGVLVMQCVGTQPQPPFFQGVHAFFINPPEIDIQFQGRLQKIIDGMQLVKAKILEVANAKMAAVVVVPNSVGALLDRSADYFEVMRPSPKGLLKLQVHRAEKLPAADTDFLGRRTSSDPYVVIRCGAQRLVSDVKSKTLNPTFNYTANLRIFSPLHQVVHVDLWDLDFGKRDDFLCGAEIPVMQLIDRSQRSEEEFHVKLTGSPAVDEACRVYLSATWHPVCCGAPGDRHAGPLEGIEGVLYCCIYDITGVPWAKPGVDYWVNVTCSHCCTTKPDSKASEATRRVTRLAVVPKDAEVMAMKQKMELLMKYDIPPDVMAEIFDVPAATLREKVLVDKAGTADLAALREIEAGRCEKIIFHQILPFLVTSCQKAALQFDVRFLPPGGRDRSLGVCTFDVKDVVSNSDYAVRRTFRLDDSERPIYLTAKMQVFSFVKKEKGPSISDVFADAKMNKS